jgi:4-carboxymuconolactone decarboxylase
MTFPRISALRSLQIFAIFVLLISCGAQLMTQSAPGPQLAFQEKQAMLSAPGTATTARTEAKAARFPQVTMEQLNEQQKAAAKEFLKVSSGGLGGPYNVLLRSPEMAAKRFALMTYLRFQTSVPRHLNEFAILIQGRLATAQYEWWAHYPLALKAGLSKAVADQLKEGKRPTAMTAEEAAVYQFCVELSLDHKVSDATFDTLKKFLNERQIVDLIVISAEYVSTSWMLNVAEAEVPNQAPPLNPMSDGELRAGLLGPKQ